MDVSQLCDIEEIKQLKARYFRLVDEKKWDEWADVFTEDFNAWFADVPDERLESRDAFVEFIRRAIGASVSIHHGHMPEIEITGPDTARGVWAMYDRLKYVNPDGSVLDVDGYGHYHEEYRRCADGRWRISRLRLTRLMGMVEQLEERFQREGVVPPVPESRREPGQDELTRK